MILELVSKLIESLFVEESFDLLIASETFRGLVINSLIAIILRSLVFQICYLKFDNF